MRGSYSGFLKLLKRPSRLYALMLTCIPHKEHSVIFLQTVQEFVHMLCAGETRFVKNVEMLCPFWRLLAASEIPLQRARFNAGFCELMRSAGSRRETAHLVA